MVKIKEIIPSLWATVYTLATNFQMYRQNSEKHYWGGGGEGNCPPAFPPPPPPPATLMAGNAKEADIKLWFGRESAREARGKFKDLVCLVVFFMLN